ncbi:MAG: T9SS type A sorting domain-containing protein [Bacteroidota bacterium]|nr:T9SS type A sorting domain-containing protein [Bacteroidota bacterium]
MSAENMKLTFVLTIIVFLSVSNLSAQNFGATGTQWYYSEHAGGMCSRNCEYLHLESATDTIINGLTTHKIIQKYYRYTGDTLQLDPIYLYEQSDTIFMWSFSKLKFLTTYIFNGNQGDTLTLDAPDTLMADTSYRLVIDTIINIIIDGVSLKKYGTTALDAYGFYNGGYFMDRIGGLDWFFPRAIIIPEAGGPIRCYSDAQIDTNFQAVACDHILTSSVDEPTSDFDIKIYPNPIFDLLTIKSKHPIERIDLYDLAGKLIVTTRELTIDFSALTSGLYILKIHLSTGQEIERKIMKNAG